MLVVWIIKSENGATSVCLQKKKERKKKSASPGSDLRGHGHGQRAWMDPGLLVCIATDLLGVCQVTKVDPNQTSTPFTEPTKESNSSSSSYFFYSPLCLFQKNTKQINKQIKENGCSVLSYRGARRAARRCTRSTSVLVLRTEQFS